MKKMFLLTVLITSSALFAADITLYIDNQTKFKPFAGGKYLATKDTYFCKRFSMNDGSPTRVPKRKYIDFFEENSTITIPSSLPSKCKYKRTGASSLKFTFDDPEDAYNAVVVYVDGGNSEEVQIVKCHTIYSGPSNNKRDMVVCYGDIHVDENSNSAKVKVIYETE